MQQGMKTHKDKKLGDIQQRESSVFLPFCLLVSYHITPVLAHLFQPLIYRSGDDELIKINGMDILLLLVGGDLKANLLLP